MAERHTAHGWWLEDAGPVDPTEPLRGSHEADVVIVGGGFAGMWAAWHLRQRAPELKIALCERETCGSGPSGRNGGFVNPMWWNLPAMRERLGDRPALALARMMERAVDEVGEFCASYAPEAAFIRRGYIRVATSPYHEDRLTSTLRTCREMGVGDASCIPLGREEMQARCASPCFGTGLLFPKGATVNPARLALAIRRELIGQEVQVFENTSVSRIRTEALGNGAGKQVIVACPGGEIRAGAAVLAAGSRLTGMRPVRRRFTVVSSHAVMTEPVPDVLAELGWTDGGGFSNARIMVDYTRTTEDGRILFGGSGGIAFGARTGGRAELDARAVSQVETQMLRYFPGLKGRRIESGWGGPIDISPTHMPVVGSVPGKPIHYGFGFTGNGVGPSHVVGQALASLTLRSTDEFTRLPIVNEPVIKVPPEPIRFLGGLAVRRALLRNEMREEHGMKPGRIGRAIADLPERLGVHINR